jgi:hypothetical protein
VGGAGHSSGQRQGPPRAWLARPGLPDERQSPWVHQSRGTRAGQSTFPWVRCVLCGGARATTRRSSSRDTIGLPVLETFRDSYGLDGTILGLPSGPVHLEIVRLGDAPLPAHGPDQLVFYLPDAAAEARMTARLAAAGVDPVAQIDYWEANGGATYQDPDGREVVFASWIYGPPGS